MGLFDQLEAHLSFLPQGSGDGYGYGGGAIVSLGNRAVFLGEGNNALAQEIVDRWNAMLGIPDPAATMKEVREVLSDLEEYFDNRSDVVDGDDRQPEPNAEMRHLTAVQSLLAKLGGE